jgi:hypothetical protein
MSNIQKWLSKNSAHFFLKPLWVLFYLSTKPEQNCAWINQKMASLIVIKNGKYFKKMRKTKMHNREFARFLCCSGLFFHFIVPKRFSLQYARYNNTAMCNQGK